MPAVAVASTAAPIAATNRKSISRGKARVNRPRSFLFSGCALDVLGTEFFEPKPQKDRMIQTKEQHIEVEGVVAVVLPGTMFRVELDNKHVVLATICGKMRKRWVRLTVGDRVKMEMSPYDLNKARITWRLR